MTKPAPLLTPDQATELATDLINSLAEHSGDREAVNVELQHWLEVLDAPNLIRVCVAAVQMTFADCLAITPLEQVPPDRLVLVQATPTERNSA
jgi:hypothetical protein